MQSKRLLRVLLTALLCCGGVVGAGGGGKGRKTEKNYRKLGKIERKCDAKIRPLRELLNLPLSSVAANARLHERISVLEGEKKALTEMMENVQAGCQAATVEPATEEPPAAPAVCSTCNPVRQCPPSHAHRARYSQACTVATATDKDDYIAKDQCTGGASGADGMPDDPCSLEFGQWVGCQCTGTHPLGCT